MVMLYVARGKRRVTILGENGQPVKVDLGDMALWDWIQPESYAAHMVFQQALYRLAQSYTALLPLVQRFGLQPVMVHLVWDVVAEAIRYRYDQQLFSSVDFWQLPDETWKRGLGDCEDTTFLTQSAIEHVYRRLPVQGGAEWESYAAIGYWIDDRGNPWGHGFVLYRDSRIGMWLWVETTLEKPLPVNLWLKWDPEKLVPVYFFNSSCMCRVDRDYERLGLDRDYVARHSWLIRMMIEYVESGVQPTFKWMHKDRRVPRYDRHIIRLQP